ncbi:MAG: DNRLRE domain-containing protein [Candidatus Hydrogenedentes bacterium]|nr:DNRLRE domain-containing protein [Candidatus Hydrogenedentota bacterium]
MRRALAAVCVIAAAGTGWAERIHVEMRQGVNGYSGVKDTLLYAPSSVADINYGRASQLSAGINRWGEHYVSLIRFDLSAVPKGAQVVSATLRLHDRDKEWPDAETVVDVQRILPANGDWPEGENTGTRVPVAGTSCWNYHSHDGRPWAGSPGLNTAGTDYAEPPMGSATVAPGHQGPIEFALDPKAVQQWIDAPETNAGMRVYPSRASAKGQVLYVYSSDRPEDAVRPALAVELEMTPELSGRYRLEQAGRSFAAVQAHLAAVRERIAAYDTPPRVRPGLERLAGTIDAIGKELGASQGLSVEESERIAGQLGAADAEVARLLDELTVARAAAANEAQGRALDFGLGVADSTANVLRAPAAFPGDFPATAAIELARNEFEAVQVVIVPIDADVVGAAWTVSDLAGPGNATIPAADVAVHVMGYMRAIKPAISTAVEWWPAPILDFLERVDVARGEIQPLWVCVRTREDTPAGVYRGTLEVAAASAEPKRMGLEVRVFDFAVPKEQHLLTVWGNNEATYEALYGERYDDAMAHAMFEFLLDHRLAVNTLYASQAAGEHGEGESVGYPTLSDPAELKRLWDAGSRWWNLGYLHPVHAKGAGLEFDAYVPVFIEKMRRSLAVADAAGWPREHLAIYMFDETKDFDVLAKAAAQVKAAFPDIRLMTTGYDRSYGVKGGPIDEVMDIWCPLTPRFAEDLEVIEEGRALGKQAWWYVCCGPRGDKPLNFFCQYPAVRSRLLMGAATWKYRPDGFLYYRISGWRHYDKPLDSGPLTEWKPYYLPGPDGDGELICPGPNGPLSTLQFENLRDGIEDFEYCWVLADLIARAGKAGADATAEAAVLGVPEGLLATLEDYSEDPAQLRAYRRRLADAIVSLQGRLGGR